MFYIHNSRYLIQYSIHELIMLYFSTRTNIIVLFIINKLSHLISLKLLKSLKSQYNTYSPIQAFSYISRYIIISSSYFYVFLLVIYTRIRLSILYLPPSSKRSLSHSIYRLTRLYIIIYDGGFIQLFYIIHSFLTRHRDIQ